MTGDDIVRQARTWLDTPFRHQGRRKGIGTDCVGLVIGVAHELGLTDFDYVGYGRTPHADVLRHHLATQMVSIPATEADVGDVLLFAFAIEPMHVGIRTDKGILHSYASAKRCVEHGLDSVWESRIRGAYRFRELMHG